MDENTSRTIKAKHEKGLLKPLEPVNLQEGEEVQIVILRGESSIAKNFYGIAKRRRRELTREELLEIIEEIENENIR